MTMTFPGTTVEVLKITHGSSRVLFDGIFATGGLTLSQVSIMTGLEPYLIQNWVKRGFVSSPVKRLYSKDQFSRIVIINMLRESLQIEKICDLIKIVGGLPDDKSDDLISDSELYHRYVDMIADTEININQYESVTEAAEKAISDFKESLPGERQKLLKILQVMAYAHCAAQLRKRSEDILSGIN